MGKLIADVSSEDGGLSDFEIDFEAVTEEVKQLTKRLEIEDKPIKIFGGTRCC